MRRWISSTNATTVSASRGWAGSVTDSNTRTCGTVSAGAIPPQSAAQPHQEVLGQQRHRQVMMPAHPAAHLVVGQPHLVLALLDGLLHRPAHPQQPHQRRRRCVRRRVAQVGLQYGVLPQRAAQDDPHVRAGQAIAHRHRPQAGHLSYQRAFAALLDQRRLPGARRQGRRQGIDPHGRGGVGGQAQPRERAALPARRRGHGRRRAVRPT